MARNTAPLPIDEILPDIRRALAGGNSLVIEAPPGAGKTTRVPALMLDLFQGDILVLEPRRLAARMAARRVAEERGEKLGATVGYRVRFDEVGGPATRLWFVTEGILTRRLLSDPTLDGVAAVVLDEFHERHIQADVALALLRRVQRTTRPDLRIVAMSATLEADPVAGFLGNCPILRSEGKMFDVAVEYPPRTDDRPLETLVAGAVRRALDEADGDVLVFLPGAREIRRAREACEKSLGSRDVLVVPLHGDLSPEEQDRAVRPAGRTKVVLSTNVAESSVTIDGVTAVIDSGLARIAGTSPWSGLSTLEIGKISRASAIQRAGRAGRTRPGRCFRLYPKQDFETRPDHDLPEIMRLDLAETVLALHCFDVARPEEFEWFEPPPEASIRAADLLLKRLGAVGPDGGLTDLGRMMARFPLHPRVARLALESARRGAGAAGCTVAALLGEQDIRREQRGGFSAAGPATARIDAPADVLVTLDLFNEASRCGFVAERLRGLGLDVGAVMRVERARRQLSQLLRTVKPGSGASEDADEAVLEGLLAAYPDRVARRRPRTAAGPNPDILLSGGGAARLADTCVVRQGEFLVAVQAEDRRDGRGVTVRSAARIEPEWLLEMFPDDVRDVDDIRWNDQAESVEVVSRLMYDKLVLDETRRDRPDDPATAKFLAEKVVRAGIERFVNRERLDRFLARVAFTAEVCPKAGFPTWSDADIEAALAEMCVGLKSFAEVRARAGGGLENALRRRLSGEQLRLLDTMAPETTNLARRRQLKIHYEIGKPPWIESRLQDFFGMERGPAVGGVPLVLHLLAPNQRPVQVTRDLTGFWDRTYAQVRRELCRRYPKHAWPEDPRKPGNPSEKRS